MDFSSYMIVTDLDGTFVHKGTAVPKNMEAVRYFTDNGGVFTIATGRIYETISRAVPHPERLVNAPAIVCNGAYLYDYGESRVFAETFLGVGDAAGLIEFAALHCPDVPYRISTPGGLRLDTPRGRLAHDVEAYGADKIEMAPVDTWRLDDWYKLVFRDEPQVLAQVHALFNRHMADCGLACFSAGERFLEIQSAACNKGTGLQKLRRLPVCHGRTVIACGDFENDIELLQTADIAVCPANALEAVKTYADYTLCDCSEGLIAEVIAMIEAGKLQKRG